MDTIVTRRCIEGITANQFGKNLCIACCLGILNGRKKGDEKRKSDENVENILEKVEDIFVSTAEEVLPTKFLWQNQEHTGKK